MDLGYLECVIQGQFQGHYAGKGQGQSGRIKQRMRFKLMRSGQVQDFGEEVRTRVRADEMFIVRYMVIRIFMVRVKVMAVGSRLWQ